MANFASLFKKYTQRLNSRYLHICLVLKMLFLSSVFAFAQSTDSTAVDSSFSIAVPHGKTRIIYFNELSHSPDLLIDIDSSLTGIQQSFNPGYTSNLGNLGSPAFPLIWQAPAVSGFRFGFDQWDFLRITKENTPYYNTQNPFTELRYVQGPEKFQIVNALHTQNILPNWNFALQLKREGSQGSYTEQNTRNGNLGFNTWYRSPNRRYMVAASAIFNDFSFEENGGLQEVSLFENDSISNNQRLSLPMRLSQARQSFSDKDFNIQQFLYFGPTQTRRVAGDSDSVSVKILKPRFYIMQQTNYYIQDYAYKDKAPLSPDSTFYPLVSIREQTNDTFSYNVFSNKAGVGYSFTDSALSKNYSLQAYLKYDYIQTQMMRYESVFHNASFGFSGQKTGKFNLGFSGEVFMDGYNAGDFFVDAYTSTTFLPSLKMNSIVLYGRIQNYSPTYIEKNYISNHFSWLNEDFTQTQTISAGGYIWDSPTGLKLGLNYTAASNYIYFGNDAQPRQANTDLQYFQLNAARNFVLGNFHFNHNIIYQKQLQGNFIRIPDLVARTSYFYQNRVFKEKPLLLQTGFDFSYNSAYKGYKYMPGQSKFYLQDAVTIGNYPVFDAWIAGQVKRFMMFFKVEHVTQGLFGPRYYNAVNYPMQPRTFRFGLKWRFYN